jgi:hypothetical protein
MQALEARGGGSVYRLPLFCTRVLIIPPPEPAPALAPLSAPVTTTHRVITYTYPSASPFDLAQDELRTGDLLYRRVLWLCLCPLGQDRVSAGDAIGNRTTLVAPLSIQYTYTYDVAHCIHISSPPSPVSCASVTSASIAPEQFRAQHKPPRSEGRAVTTPFTNRRFYSVPVSHRAINSAASSTPKASVRRFCRKWRLSETK